VQRWHLDYGVEAKPVDDGAVHLKTQEKEALLVWPEGAVKAMEIYPLWHMPLWREGEGDERPLVVDAHFGPEEEASLRMLIIALPEGGDADATIDAARGMLQEKA